MQNKSTPLRDARKAKGWSLTEFSAALKVDLGHLSRVERGEAAASPALAEKAVAALGEELIHEMQVLYPERYKGRKIKLGTDAKAPPLRLKVGNFLYALIGAADGR